MKAWKWVLAVWVGGALMAQADLVGTYKTIVVDGSFSGWTGADLMYGDSDISDGDPDNSSYQNIYLANDASFLYIALQTKGTGGGSVTNSYTRNIYIDSDMDSGTGFNSGWMTGGYDNLVQYGAGGGSYSVFSHTGGDQSAWSWNFDGLISYSYDDSFIELAVSLAALGLSPGDSARIEFHVTGSGVNTETWANQSESSVGTYQLGVVPEPGTALLFSGGILLAASLRRRRQHRG
ncbi:MAG: PEP-CTERM sorting domain-containing protein [Verrucomicrobia bacterium]|nr:PEP-CTERM sorting domain-containing protein [Kiritimatiellia bacterium]MCO6401368.1 PEP-CTERM sorting domain-containing protein [Verrucomicrobiota bacterium]